MDIKKFDNFILLLKESYDNPVDINWIENNNSIYDGEFYVNGIKYTIECSEWDNNIWTYKFYRVEEDEKIIDLVNDSVNKMSVLSTIRKGMINLIEEKKPYGIIINIIDDSRGRDYLWERYSKEISKEYDYHFKKNIIFDKSSFFLWKDEIISFDMMNASFNKMIRVFQNM